MPGGRGGWQLASVPATQPTDMSPEGKVSGNGRKQKRMRRRNGGIGLEMMGGIAGTGKMGAKEEQWPLQKGRQPPLPPAL